MFTSKNLLLGTKKPTVRYDATGNGVLETSSYMSWTHTVGASANALVASVGSTNEPESATYGGYAMTVLGGNYVNYNFVDYYIWLYGMLDPPTGSNTVAVGLYGGGYTAANSVSYANVTGFGTTQGGQGSGTTASLSIPTTTGQQMVAAAFFSTGTSGAFGTPNHGTTRFSYAYDFGVSYPLSYVDFATPNAVTISESNPGGADWVSIGVPIL